jgi:soluble lytic murein transglycosylase-like protein
MVTSLLTITPVSRINALGYRLALLLILPALAASPCAAQQVHITTVVRADAKTGRLVRSFAMEPRVVSPRLVADAAPSASDAPDGNLSDRDLKEMIDRIADEQGVEAPLVHSVIRAESNYNAFALSPRGAQGIMQLIPETARRFGVANPFNLRDNIQGGVRYLRFLLDYYQGDYPKAIAAYNAGEKAVDRYNGIPPYAETQNYVFQVAKNLRTARQAPARPATIEVANSETSRTIQASTGSDGRIYYRTP